MLPIFEVAPWSGGGRSGTRFKPEESGGGGASEAGKRPLTPASSLRHPRSEPGAPRGHACHWRGRIEFQGQPLSGSPSVTLAFPPSALALAGSSRCHRHLLILVHLAVPGPCHLHSPEPSTHTSYPTPWQLPLPFGWSKMPPSPAHLLLQVTSWVFGLAPPTCLQPPGHTQPLVLAGQPSHPGLPWLAPPSPPLALLECSCCPDHDVPSPSPRQPFMSGAIAPPHTPGTVAQKDAVAGLHGRQKSLG